MKKKLIYLCLIILLILVNIGVITHTGETEGSAALNITLKGTEKAEIQVFSEAGAEISGMHSEVQSLDEENTEMTLTYHQTSDTEYTRIDFGSLEGTYEISRMWYEYGDEVLEVDLSSLTEEAAVDINQIRSAELKDGVLIVETEAEDPYITAEIGLTELRDQIRHDVKVKNQVKNLIYLILIDLIVLAAFLLRKQFMTLPMELIGSRELIFQMAKNDFQTKYAGSVLGAVWAFVQPCVTVLVYWFVFGIIGGADVVSRTGESYQFVLWLVAGLVPWFFFQDTMIGGTNALLEYTYLVKKVVFKISVLPIIKEISALFVHIFFIALMFVLYIAGGHFPDIYWLQVFYYTFALFIYALACCYATCAIVVFFRDLSQLISIIIQVQIWMTPIMWNINTMGSRMPGWVLSLLKLNPIYYIVCGYRDSMIDKVWFWQNFDLTIYFWLITAVFFGLGAFIFKRLKPHFADIL